VLSTPEFSDLAGELNEITRRLYQAAFTAAAMPRARLDSLNLRLAHASPDWRIRSGRQALDGLAARLNQSAGHRASLERSRLGSLRASLAALSPLNVLNRGYALLSRADGRLVTSASAAHPGDRLHARLRDGALEVQVLKTEKPASTQRSAE
jgi:exodeoxyribonuclease VII large subunit